MTQLDEFVESLKRDFDRGTKSRISSEAHNLHSKISRAKAKGQMDRVRELAKLYKTIKSANFEDPSFKRLSYIRYADD
jgi:hypothetical protein